jgi:hypothetical protein
MHKCPQFYIPIDIDAHLSPRPSQVMRGKATLSEARFKTDLINMHVTWPVEVGPESPFPITNIPFGIFSTQDLVRILIPRPNTRSILC